MSRRKDFIHNRKTNKNKKCLRIHPTGNVQKLSGRKFHESTKELVFETKGKKRFALGGNNFVLIGKLWTAWNSPAQSKAKRTLLV